MNRIQHLTPTHEGNPYLYLNILVAMFTLFILITACRYFKKWAQKKNRVFKDIIDSKEGEELFTPPENI